MLVALYARVSTTKQADKDLSIPDQLRQLQAWCRQQGHVVVQEYVEPGASATDDRRPVFQQLIHEATLSPSPFGAVIVHSLSRFFRDSLEFGLYERRLNKAGVKLISITQQTGDDPAGEMARKIFNVFDEYQSKENGKHTLRAMKENARQGFCNGRPPFGYRSVEVERMGNKGQRKRRMEIDPQEAVTVKHIFALYQRGDGGAVMGAKDIATWLNRQGMTHRGTAWTRSRVHEVLSNQAYIGEYFFNKRDSKTKQLKPVTEWVRLDIPALLDPAEFEAVQQLRHARSPAVVPPRQLSSPTLLTGLLKCGQCGAGMTLVTGKSGRYRYYKCNNRVSKDNQACSNPSVPMERLDQLVVQALIDKVLQPDRLRLLLAEGQARRRVAQRQQQDDASRLKAELDKVQQAVTRLYEAVEQGVLPLDADLQARAQQLKNRRAELLLQSAQCERLQQLPPVRARQIQAFGQALQTKLRDSGSGFAKAYLRLLVAEIRVTGRQVEMAGRRDVLALAVAECKEGTAFAVPSFGHTWLGDNEQNIAAMFREAEQSGAVLLLDEAESLLRDRERAVQRGRCRWSTSC